MTSLPCAEPTETVNVGVLNMPDKAIAEFALTRFEQSVGTKGQGGPPQDRYAKVILPLDATRDVTLIRTHPPVTMREIDPLKLPGRTLS